jgi:hypothetical protein
MALRDSYRRQVALLIRVMPFVAEEPMFGLKGGTAINLFVRNMPRLSVDIDLTYLPVEDRETSLANIGGGMRRIAERIANGIPGSSLALSVLPADKIVSKIMVRAGDALVKIEVTPVLRGCVYDPVIMTVSQAVEASYGFAEMQVVSFADLYAGKIVAALDRQHPRDLFDVRDLLANEGVSDELRQAFIIYLISHDRSIAEVLAPKRKDLSDEYAKGFEGMTADPVSLDELKSARESIIKEMVEQMPAEHRRFLVSVKAGEPDWALLDIPHARELPAVRWKLQNLDKLTVCKRSDLLERLQVVLGLAGATSRQE